MVSQIKTVCFDLDDTLVDNESGEEERLRKALGPLAERFPSFDIEDLIDRAMTIDPVQGRLVTLITETGLVDPKLTDEAYDLYDETVLENRRIKQENTYVENQTPWQEIYRTTVGQLSTGGIIELAEKYKVSAERIRQIEKRALEQMQLAVTD